MKSPHFSINIFEPVKTQKIIFKARGMIKKTFGKEKHTEEAVCLEGNNQGDNNMHSSQNHMVHRSCARDPYENF